MPRVLVTTDGPKQSRQVLVDELVNPEHLDYDPEGEPSQGSVQLLERLAWGIEDAVRAEASQRDVYSPARSYTEVGA